MPTLKICCNKLSTRPFSSDDLQLVCLIIGLCRVLQLICVAPIWLHTYMWKFRQGQDDPYWCDTDLTETAVNSDSYQILDWESEDNIDPDVTVPAPNQSPSNSPNISLLDLGNEDLVASGKTSEGGQIFLRLHLMLSLLWVMGDIAILCGIWSASSIGTPTQLMGRDKFLRPLLKIKLFVMFPFLALTVVLGIAMVYMNRTINWGCPGTFTPGTAFEATGYYTLFCVVLVSQSLEVFLWPSIAFGKSSAWIRRNNPLRLVHATGKDRSTSLDVCMTGCFKFCNMLSCKRSDMKRSGELKDAAEALLAFFSDGVGITWTDLYISIRVLAQIQRERKLERVQMALDASKDYAELAISRSLEEAKKKIPPTIPEHEDSTSTSASNSVHCTNATTLLAGDLALSGNTNGTCTAAAEDEDFDDDSIVFYPTGDSENSGDEINDDTGFFSARDFDDDVDESFKQQQLSRKSIGGDSSVAETTTTDNTTSEANADIEQPSPNLKTSAPSTSDRSIPAKRAKGTSQRIQRKNVRAGLDKKASVAVLVRNEDSSGEFETYKPVYRHLLQPGNPDDIRRVQNSIRYAKHSNAVYNDVVDLCKNYYKLGIDIFNIAEHEKRPRDMFGKVLDSFMEHSITLDTLGIENSVLAYSNFSNGIDKTPYYISIDSSTREVLVVIRGTASMEDAVIDLQLIPLDLTEVGVRCGFNGTNQKCHKGVLTRCLWIYEDLQKHQVLQDLLHGDNARFPLYKLIVTGHSLGAGCAAMLSIMLHNEFPELRCFAIEPPGGLLSRELAESCNDFIYSLVNGADVIPRMSYLNMEKVRDEALEALARIRVSKVQVYRSLRLPHADKYVAEMNSRLLYPKDEETHKNTEFWEQLEEFRNRKQKKLLEHGSMELYLPGRVMYVFETKKGTYLENGEQKTARRCTPQWAERTDFNEILLSNRALEDHTMASILANLHSILDYLTNPNRILVEEEHPSEDFELMDTKTRQIKNPTLILDNDFICCSRPHGIRSLIGAISTTVACVLTMSSNSTCEFVSRTTTVVPQDDGTNVTAPAFYGKGVSTGLYSFAEKEYDGIGDPNDPDSFNPTGQCVPYPVWFEVDAYLRSSRAFGSLAVITCGIAMIMLWLSTCIRIPFKQWVCHSFCLVLALVFQSLVAVFFFQSTICTQFDYTENDAFFDIYSDCEGIKGVKFGKACVGVLVGTVLITAWFPKPKF